ncbi:FAD-dependent oxidoreductase [Allostreptomyces psammosilenae]|uniref:Thioredoxin reductase (NADPH)/alkyl hydroperoxide reductase subunit F n=1 Tax=Allostreptomyces psammosilenae TaxID=1892865 RepID=A0A852ZVI7_9ACTN|nr:FAD-dependent oxidoreductase [Allostreptomyces psammosilenae]NYI06396.1 thioredoxin reductase (NADPH)/alkyl hydroperoxide reductase subunit F [Allostreptomyces psammosilenae]
MAAILETDLVIVGGGPAGCAAAVMAASLGMASVLVEARDRLCSKLYAVPALDNVLGGFRTGPELAAAVTRDVERVAGSGDCRLLLGARADIVETEEPVRGRRGAAPAAGVVVRLVSGEIVAAPHAVVATGVGPTPPESTSWVAGAEKLRLPPLWEADLAACAGRTVLVVGADRPLGTLLRALPDTRLDLLVPHPVTDDYKTEEARRDDRAQLIPVRRLSVARSEEPATPGPPIAPHPLRAEVELPDGTIRHLAADAGFLNIGSTPCPPRGDLARDLAGYCPPGRQHPRLLVAGDLRSAGYQRIMAASGSGAEAALRAYYARTTTPPPG